jgi:hypothetical protein
MVVSLACERKDRYGFSWCGKVCAWLEPERLFKTEVADQLVHRGLAMFLFNFSQNQPRRIAVVTATQADLYLQKFSRAL